LIPLIGERNCCLKAKSTRLAWPFPADLDAWASARRSRSDKRVERTARHSPRARRLDVNQRSAGEVLQSFAAIQKEFNASPSAGRSCRLRTDLLAARAIERAAKPAIQRESPSRRGWTLQEQTDADSFAPLEPTLMGRNYLRASARIA